MPKDDWVRARVFGWMTALLYFNKLLQIPFVILNGFYSLSFKTIFETFILANASYPTLSEIYSFFYNKAKDIQNGGTEYCESKKWLNIWWPADELMLIKLFTENKISDFYRESERLISDILKRSNAKNYHTVLHESILLNQNLLKMPFQDKNVKLKL